MFVMDEYYNGEDYGLGQEFPVHTEKCAYCGKDILQPDESMVINANKLVVHIDCWGDYAVDNYEEFLSGYYI